MFLILPHPDSPLSLYHLEWLAFILLHSPALVLSHWQCSVPILEASELSRKVNLSPLKLAVLRAGLLHLSNSEQDPNSPVSYGCHCFVYMAHRANSEWQGKNFKKIFAEWVTKVFILPCNKPQDCLWGTDLLTDISNNFQQLREVLFFAGVSFPKYFYNKKRENIPGCDK